MPTKKQLAEANRLLADFYWSEVDGLTDDQIIEAARTDPNSSLPSDDELARFDLVIPAKSRRRTPKEAAE